MPTSFIIEAASLFLYKITTHFNTLQPACPPTSPIFEPPYPAPYCTHINILITTNHFLTPHFTLPSALLYSHQHTDHHKPFPHCTLHLTQRLTVLTSTY